ncbi:hypothetical protein CEXT_708101 [Caerostris extrusa]|uniref:Uncharacterized protein n=1 Tax=Caerostris extrusa TaxID=172846 RepID=A0AAV4Y8B4_CAEEX|nr:hypothetical protein CEXT_708101 [Caerostris extrusa]
MLKLTQNIFIPNYSFFRNDGPQNLVSGGTAILSKTISSSRSPHAFPQQHQTTIISVHFSNIPPPHCFYLCSLPHHRIRFLADLTTSPIHQQQFNSLHDFNSHHIQAVVIPIAILAQIFNFSVRTGLEIIIFSLR